LPTDDAPADTLDARGLKCPLPVLKAEKRLAALPAGGRLLVLATDPMARVDLPLFCRQHGYACTESRDGDTWRFAIRKPA
jgi:tRNA 2-thiouridine synthesizing protein A